MGALRRLLAILLAIALIAAMALVAPAIGVSLRALPRTSGSLTVPELHAAVTVWRDEAGIAWIEADDPHDLFLAQGYVHASERFWQMEVWRRITAGRMSELFGASTLEIDRYVRTLDWQGAALADLNAMSPDVRVALASYADGVNAWLDDQDGRLGLPFVVAGLLSGTGGLAGYQPERWTPLDSVAFQKLQAFNLGGNLDVEIFRMLADARLGDPARTDDLFPEYPDDGPVITPAGLLPPTVGGDSGAASPTETPAESQAAAAPSSAGAPSASAAPATDLTTAQAAAWRSVGLAGGRLLELAGFDRSGGLAGDHGIGSNNWVIGPSASASGGALLANDPHLGISMPGIWYMNGLRCRIRSDECPWNVVGVSFPSAPAIVLGHNDRIAWGATNADPDVQDLVIETPDPADAARYLADGGSRPFDVRTEVIEVAGRDPDVLVVRSTDHGPILNDVDSRLKDAPPMALRWTSIDRPDGTFEAIFRVNTTADFAGFREALRGYGSPAQNFVYADVDGHIGYVLPGDIPIRSNPDDRSERPVRRGESEWLGLILYDELPWQLDPPGARIVTANNAAVDDAYPYFLGRDWDRGDRARRALELLAPEANPNRVGVDDMRKVQLDTTVLRARRIIPGLVGAAPLTDDGRTVLARIRAWDATCPRESQGCAAYLAFELALLRAIFDDDLGLQLAADYVGSPFSWQRLEALLDEPDSAWWANATPGAASGRDAVVARALDQTGADLRAALGGPGRWTWGRLHTATFSEATFGSSGIAPLEWAFNLGPRPVPGAAGALFNTYYRIDRGYPDPDDPEAPVLGLRDIFSVTNLPSYRLLIDMSDLDGARIVTTTGQSGNPLDRHYGDLIDTWANGGAVRLPFGRAQIVASAVATLRLLP